jgi:hypothetical protein
MSTVVKVAKWLFEHKDFASAFDVSEAIGVDRRHVSSCFIRIIDSNNYRIDCRWRKNRTGRGRKVRYLKVTEIISMPLRKVNKMIPVVGKNLRTGEETVFSSIAQAVSELGFVYKQGISACINGRARRHAGYQWSKCQGGAA